MKKLKLLIATLTASVILFSLCSCGAKITVEEIKEVLPALIDESKVLNEIYFGEGFKVDGDISDVAANGGYYYCDCESYGFYSISEIKEATEKVFTKEYATLLYQAAFDGIATDSAVEPARYREGEFGLMQRADGEKYVLPDREYDYSSLNVQKRNGNSITVRINTSVNGIMSDAVTLIVVREGIKGEYNYRLDSPTY